MSDTGRGPSRPAPIFDIASLDEWLDIFSVTDDTESAFDAFCKAIEPFEFTFISMGRLLPAISGDQSTKNIPRQFHLSRGGEAWVDEMVSTGSLITKSPLVLYGMRVSTPFRWRDAYQNLSEDQEKHVREAALSVCITVYAFLCYKSVPPREP